LKGREIRADSNEMAEAIFGLCKPLHALFKHNGGLLADEFNTHANRFYFFNFFLYL
jgi:hypothetical protein